jgi:hypothetical protein
VVYVLGFSTAVVVLLFTPVGKDWSSRYEKNVNTGIAIWEKIFERKGNSR